MSLGDFSTNVIRIGSVPYLNSKVLIYGLPKSSPKFTLECHVPSILARKLRQGELDIALVSSIEYYRNLDCVILPNFSVSGHREMWSVKLFHRVPLQSARRVGLDPSSETTNALLQIILHEKLALGIELVRLSPDEDPLARQDLDGFLKIGDPCLSMATPPGYEAMDLTAEWSQFTNLPFVFALWLARRGVDLENVNQNLYMAKQEGLRHTEDIAKVEGPRLGLDIIKAKTYISKIVHYDLGRAELGGLDLFRRYLIRQGLAPDGKGFEFYSR